MTTTSSAIQSFTCEICGTGFTSFEKLKDHTHRLHGGDGEVKKSRMVMPEGRTTLFALGVALGLVAAGSVAWYLSKRRQY
jgi:hypothetical protein